MKKLSIIRMILLALTFALPNSFSFAVSSTTQLQEIPGVGPVTAEKIEQ